MGHLINAHTRMVQDVTVAFLILCDLLLTPPPQASTPPLSFSMFCNQRGDEVHLADKQFCKAETWYPLSLSPEYPARSLSLSPPPHLTCLPLCLCTSVALSLSLLSVCVHVHMHERNCQHSFLCWKFWWVCFIVMVYVLTFTSECVCFLWSVYKEIGSQYWSETVSAVWGLMNMAESIQLGKCCLPGKLPSVWYWFWCALVPGVTAVFQWVCGQRCIHSQ